jgi:hypothetical protein
VQATALAQVQAMAMDGDGALQVSDDLQSVDCYLLTTFIGHRGSPVIRRELRTESGPSTPRVIVSRPLVVLLAILRG